jgi:hypothetical protein
MCGRPPCVSKLITGSALVLKGCIILGNKKLENKKPQIPKKKWESKAINTNKRKPKIRCPYD